jgi:hypothetical protein
MHISHFSSGIFILCCLSHQLAYFILILGVMGETTILIPGVYLNRLDIMLEAFSQLVERNVTA